MGKALTLWLLLALPALGQNYFTNSNFATPANSWNGGFFDSTGFQFLTSDGVPSGWTWTTGVNIGGGVTVASNWLTSLNPGSGTPAPGGDGSQWAFLLNLCVMSQTITVPTNGQYNLSFVAGNPTPYYSIDNLSVAVDGTAIGRWTAPFFATGFVPITTNLNLAAGPHVISFIPDTNGVPGGSDGWGIDIGSVQTAPFYSGFTFNDTTRTANSDGSYVGTFNALQHIGQNGSTNWILFVGTNGGVYYWPSGLTISLPAAATIAGSSQINRPTIIFTNAAANDGIYINANAYTTLRDLVFNITNSGPVKEVIGIDGSNVCFRVSNCQFLNSAPDFFVIKVCTGVNSSATAGPWGLIDHCQFYLPNGSAPYNYINARNNGAVTNVNYGWTQNMTWGTTNCVIIETNAFSQPYPGVPSGVVEADGGARICLRNNFITNAIESTHGWASGAHTGTLQLEMYTNTFVMVTTQAQPEEPPAWYVQRGGSAVIFGNTFLNLMPPPSAMGGFLQFREECAETFGTPPSWETENCLYQIFYPANYPGPQQIGQGVVAGVQALQPVYVWSNSPVASANGISLGLDGSSAPFIQQGRDIFTNSPMPGYVALVYPSPQDVPFNPTNAPPPTPSVSLLIPLGHIAHGLFLH